MAIKMSGATVAQPLPVVRPVAQLLHDYATKAELEALRREVAEFRALLAAKPVGKSRAAYYREYRAKNKAAQ